MKQDRESGGGVGEGKNGFNRFSLHWFRSWRK